MNKKLKDMPLKQLWRLFPIQIEEYNDKWTHFFNEEKGCLMSIGDFFTQIYHIGSTAVKGAAAKPIIDIIAEIRHDCDISVLKKVMSERGYLINQRAGKPLPCIMFLKGYTENGFAEKVYHIHIRYNELHDEILFRDYLNGNTTIREQYEKLKKSLAVKYKFNRDGYTDAKTRFVKKYTEAAKALFKNKTT